MSGDAFGRIVWGHFQLEGRPIYYEIVERRGQQVLQACELGRGGPVESFPVEWKPAIEADIEKHRARSAATLSDAQ